MNPIKRKQMEEKLAAAEAAVPQLEAAITAAESELADFVSVEITRQLTEELNTLRRKHASALEKWESICAELDAEDQFKIGSSS